MVDRVIATPAALELIDALGSITEHRLEHLELVKDMLDAEWEVRQASGDLPQVQP